VYLHCHMEKTSFPNNPIVFLRVLYRYKSLFLDLVVLLNYIANNVLKIATDCGKFSGRI
jgi:hypothetical protein